MNVIKENATYLLDTLAGYEPEDIEQDEFEVAVNDDQFGQCSIVLLAEISSAIIKELEHENKKLKDIIDLGLGEKDLHQDSIQSNV